MQPSVTPTCGPAASLCFATTVLIFLTVRSRVSAGMPSSKTGAKGNLRLRFDIQFPRKLLSEQERRQLDALLAGKY